MSRLVVIGTSGHARSCLDVLIDGGHEVVGCVGAPPGKPIQVPHLGDDDTLAALMTAGVTNAVIAVGSNTAREAIFQRLLALGFEFPVVVARSAYVAPTAQLGAGTVVLQGGIVGPYARVGVGSIVNTGASVDHDCVLGDFVHVAPGSRLAGDVTLGSGVFIGAGAVVIPNVSVGPKTVVGAGGVVTSDVASNVTVVGVPATMRGSSS